MFSDINIVAEINEVFSSETCHFVRATSVTATDRVKLEQARSIARSLHVPETPATSEESSVAAEWFNFCFAFERYQDRL